MNRAGLLIIGAVIVAAAALSAIFFTDVLGTKTPSSTAMPVKPEASQSAGSREAQLVNQIMSQAAAGTGFAANFSEQDVGKWQIAGGHRIERFSIDPTGSVFARLTSTVPLDKSSVVWPSLGLSVTLPPEFAAMVNGRKIEVGLVARSSQANGAPAVDVIYATRGAGNSGWQEFALKPSFEAFKFTYDVPKLEEGYSNGPMIVLHSDPTGSGHSVEMLGLYVKLAQ